MRNAVSGMIIPIAREYPLVIHCPIDVLIPKYSTTLGRAVVIAVDKIDDAIPDTTRQRKIIVLLPLLNCISFLFSMMFLHSVPYFLIDIVCHPLQGTFCQRQFLPGDIPAQRLIEVCVDCLDPLSCRNGFLCQIQMLHPPVLLISCDAYISYFAEFLYCLCQRGTVNAEPFRHLLRSRTRMSVKILHIELLAPADLKFRESPIIIHFHEP